MTGPGAQGRDDFAEFVTASSAQLLRTAWLLTGDADAARDLVQAALVKAYVAWPGIRRPEALAYTRRILVNENVDSWRRTRREVSVADVPEPVPSRALDRTATALVDQRDQIVRMLAQLPEGQRKVVVLRYYADLPEAAVAGILGLSLGAVKSAASRGLATLRRLRDHAEGLADAD